MSSALVRQALEFVAPEETNKQKRSKCRTNLSRDLGDTVQGSKLPYNKKNRKSHKKVDTKNTSAEDNIKKLLALSAPVSEHILKDKILERAIKGKPLLEKVEKPKEDETSILFPEEETFKQFEKGYFCS